jgi:cell division protein FtsW (lipid II flippase)
MQVVWCVFGFILCVVAASLDYQLFKKYAWPIFGLAFFAAAGAGAAHGRKNQRRAALV